MSDLSLMVFEVLGEMLLSFFTTGKKTLTPESPDLPRDLPGKKKHILGNVGQEREECFRKESLDSLEHQKGEKTSKNPSHKAQKYRSRRGDAVVSYGALYGLRSQRAVDPLGGTSLSKRSSSMACDAIAHDFMACEISQDKNPVAL